MHTYMLFTCILMECFQLSYTELDEIIGYGKNYPNKSTLTGKGYCSILWFPGKEGMLMQLNPLGKHGGKKFSKRKPIR